MRISWTVLIAAVLVSLAAFGVTSIASAAPTSQPDITTAQTFTVLAHATNFKRINVDGKGVVSVDESASKLIKIDDTIVANDSMINASLGDIIKAAEADQVVMGKSFLEATLSRIVAVLLSAAAVPLLRLA